jgi:cytochrome c biogenesis protein CcmG, thiol:disulfide interchange protein DsbE
MFRSWQLADRAAMPRRRLLGWTLVAAAAIAALSVFGLASHSASGRPAPPLPHERLAGQTQTLTSLLAGARDRPVAVVFWASWCGPCSHEAPALERFSQTAAGRGRIIGVDWSDALSGARAFIRRYSWSFPNVRDAEGTVGNAYRLPGLPTTFIVDGRGRIRTVLRGPQSERSLHTELEGVEHS